ncbi:MAG: ABC transporter permease subunit [Clostridia bacterium]|nr:ABC transporter permease subunit [Clostridia bacterium]
MFSRELKINLKNFCIWSLVTVLLFGVVFLVYPSIINGPEVESLNEMMKAFPEDILKAFNMDISSIDSVYGWLKSEGFVFVLLIVGCYAGLLGSNILLKEESDKTVEYLGTLPVKRTRIVIDKISAGVIYIVCFTVLAGVFNYVGLALSDDFDKKQYVLLSITPILSSVPIFFICMFLSTFTNKTKKMAGISLGFVLVSYILNTLSSLSENIKFLQYFSVFTLSDIRNVITDKAINANMIITGALISAVCIALTLVRYYKKELV